MRESLRILFLSEAFMGYVNSYLYFGIRFLASRKEHRRVSQRKELPTCADSNVRSCLLFAPPKLTGYSGVQEKRALG